MKTNNKLNKIRSKAKDVCVWIVIGLVIGCIVGWSTHTAIYNISIMILDCCMKTFASKNDAKVFSMQ